MKEKKCGTCKYFDYTGSLCRKESPYADVNEEYRAKWPVAHCEFDWCDEWEKRND